jgi:hypothetical protein
MRRWWLHCTEPRISATNSVRLPNFIALVAAYDIAQARHNHEEFPAQDGKIALCSADIPCASASGNRVAAIASSKIYLLLENMSLHCR